MKPVFIRKGLRAADEETGRQQNSMSKNKEAEQGSSHHVAAQRPALTWLLTVRGGQGLSSSRWHRRAAQGLRGGLCDVPWQRCLSWAWRGGHRPHSLTAYSPCSERDPLIKAVGQSGWQALRGPAPGTCTFLSAPGEVLRDGARDQLAYLSRSSVSQGAQSPEHPLDSTPHTPGTNSRPQHSTQTAAATQVTQGPETLTKKRLWGIGMCEAQVGGEGSSPHHAWPCL